MTPMHPQCARHFISIEAKEEHVKTKLHKKRLRLLRDAPYTQTEADAAAGLGTYVRPVRKEVPVTSLGVGVGVVNGMNEAVMEGEEDAPVVAR